MEETLAEGMTMGTNEEQTAVVGDAGLCVTEAKFAIGDVVRHRIHPFRGVIYDVDPVFSNSEEWYQSIPEHLRPAREQPYYHLLAENSESTYEAYVSEQNLLPDESGEPCRHPLVDNLFREAPDGGYAPRENTAH